MSLLFNTQEPHHFSDYGFDPQPHITHFQFSEESRKQCRRAAHKPIDAIRFKLKKPISKDEYKRTSTKSKTKKNSKRWWKNAVSYLKSKWADNTGPKRTKEGHKHQQSDNLLSRPVYATESRSGSGRNTPFRSYYNTTPFGMMDEAPYLRLQKMNMCDQQRISTSSTPLYLVT